MIAIVTDLGDGVTAEQVGVRVTVFEGGAGPAGEDGPAGADGPPGADGASAFEVAVAAGFAGSEAAWLASLVGPEGPEGPAGADGAGVVATVVAPLVLTGDVLSLDGSGFEAAGAAADAQAAAEATASGALATHAADTTAVHGIADTAALVLTSDARLSDARTPTAHAASHGSAGSDAVTLAQSQVTGLTTDLAAKQPIDSDLTAIAALTTTTFGRSLLEAANAAGLRTLAGLVLGTDIYSKAAVDSGFQPLDSDLTAIAALSTTTFGRALLALADAAAARTALGLGSAAVLSEATVKTEVIGVALSDETTAITTGTAKATIRMPFAMTLTAVRASLTTASSSGLPTVDINEGGTSILSTKLTVDATEKTSTTAATPAVISDASLADDAEVTFDIDVAGTGATGLKVWLIGTRA